MQLLPRGDRILPEEVLQAIYDQKVLAKNYARFDFATHEIIPAFKPPDAPAVTR